LIAGLLIPFIYFTQTLQDEIKKLQKQLYGSPQQSPLSPTFPQTPGGPGSSSNGQQQSTPSTKKSLAGRAYTTPVLSLTPPATPASPRFQRQPPSMDDDVNIEYLKNVLLNFLEYKERRVSYNDTFFFFFFFLYILLLLDTYFFLFSF
jgi:hypothetical protein